MSWGTATWGTSIWADYVEMGHITEEDEIRAVFIHSANSSAGINAETVCSILESYGINLIVLEGLGINYARYPSVTAPGSADFNILPEFVTACHNHGMQLYVSMNVLAETSLDATDYMTQRYNGGSPITGGTASPFKQDTLDLIQAEVQELVNNYNIDGFMFDYMRFTYSDEPYESQAETQFKADTGITWATWGADTHVPGAVYYSTWWQWKCDKITELVGQIRTWIRAIRPIGFAAATWNYFSTGDDDYWKKNLGQDPVAWNQAGYLDFVCPMVYTDDVDAVSSAYLAYKDDFTVPVVLFIDSCIDNVSTAQNLANRITTLQILNAPGWIIWRYGGVGDNTTSPNLEYTLTLIDNPTEEPEDPDPPIEPPELDYYFINVSSDGNGLVNPQGWHQILSNAITYVTATPNTDYLFSHFTVNGVTKTSNPLPIIPTINGGLYTVRAYFIADTPVEPDPPVVPDPENYSVNIGTSTGVTTNLVGTQTLVIGAQLTVVATLKPNYKFNYWLYDNTAEQQGSLTFTKTETSTGQHTLLPVVQYVAPPPDNVFIPPANENVAIISRSKTLSTISRQLTSKPPVKFQDVTKMLKKLKI